MDKGLLFGLLALVSIILIIVSALNIEVIAVEGDCYDRHGSKIIGLDCMEYKVIFPWYFWLIYISWIIGSLIFVNWETDIRKKRLSRK